MKDSDFKVLNHPVSSGNLIATTGQQVSLGYKPDITIKDADGILRFIIESEQKTDRKAFLGDLIKAEMYSENEQCSPELIIVMKTASNTTTKQIADHLRPYKNWIALKNSGSCCLSNVHVLSDDEYISAINSGETLGSNEFKRRGHLV